jgi:hypothetical protein
VPGDIRLIQLGVDIALKMFPDFKYGVKIKYSLSNHLIVATRRVQKQTSIGIRLY